MPLLFNVMQVAEATGTSLQDIRQWSPDDFALWLAYFKIKDQKSKSKPRASSRGKSGGF